MTDFEQGYFDKMAQQGVSPEDARMIAEMVAARAESERKTQAIKKENPLRGILRTAIGAGKGALAGGGVMGGASLVNDIGFGAAAKEKEMLDGIIAKLDQYHIPHDQPMVPTILERALAHAKSGLMPGAFMGGVVGAAS